MAENTKIEWATHTFNPWVGCTKVSPACDHCYAESWAKRSGMVKWGAGEPRRRTSDANWRDDSSLQVWFPYTHEELARLRETLQGIADADWRRWEELATPDEFVRWAKSRAAHALRPNAEVSGRPHHGTEKE